MPANTKISYRSKINDIVKINHSIVLSVCSKMSFLVNPDLNNTSVLYLLTKLIRFVVVNGYSKVKSVVYKRS